MLARVARCHVCFGCGSDLASVPAPPDPHYGLPVVVCHGCGVACVRRPYGGTARWRSAGRACWTTWTFVARLAALTALPALIGAAAWQMATELYPVFGRDPMISLFNLSPARQRLLSDWIAESGAFLLPVWLAASLCTGIVAGLLFPHWRLRWWPVGAGAGLAVAVLLPALIVGATEWSYSNTLFWPEVSDAMPEWRELRIFLWLWGSGMVVAWGLMPAGQRAARRYFEDRGLRAWGLKKARKRRSKL